MVDKLIDAVINYLKDHYDSRARLARDIKKLDQALQDCNLAWVKLSSNPHFAVRDDTTAVARLSDADKKAFSDCSKTHRKAVRRLVKAFRKLEFILETYCPDTEEYIDSYVYSESAIHDPMFEYLDTVVTRSVPADFEAAARKLREFVRENFKPEEFH